MKGPRYYILIIASVQDVWGLPHLVLTNNHDDYRNMLSVTYLVFDARSNIKFVFFVVLVHNVNGQEIKSDKSGRQELQGPWQKTSLDGAMTYPFQ
jgi:hypothetical protein